MVVQVPHQVVVDRYYEVEPDKSYAWDMEVKVVNRSARKQAVKMKITIPTVDSEKEGFVFQNFQLIPTLTALENVLVPVELRRSLGGSDGGRAEERALRLLV